MKVTEALKVTDVMLVIEAMLSYREHMAWREHMAAQVIEVNQAIDYWGHRNFSDPGGYSSYKDYKYQKSYTQHNSCSLKYVFRS